VRWAIVAALSAQGVVDDDGIQAELDRDPSSAGHRYAATARALRPSAAAKVEAWRLATEDDSVPNAMQEAVIVGFSHPTQGALLEPYVPRYFDVVPEVWRSTQQRARAERRDRLFPHVTSTITETTLDAADEFLDRSELRRHCAAW